MLDDYSALDSGIFRERNSRREKTRASAGIPRSARFLYTPAQPAFILNTKSAESGFCTDLGFENQTSFPPRHRVGHCVPPSERGSARALALRGRTCAPPLRRSLGRKVFRATLCVSHSRRRRSPSIPNLTINSATWRLSTPRSLPELINSHAHEMYYQRFVGLSAQLFEKQGLLTSTSSSRRAATKSTAKALSLCGARCRGVWRSCAPGLAPRCAAWCSLWGGFRAFKFSLLASLENRLRRLGHARSSARARKSETSRAPPQVLAHGHTCSRKSGEALSSLGQHRACARVQRPAKR